MRLADPADLATRLDHLSVASADTADTYLASARATLRFLTDHPTLIDTAALPRKPQGYTRNLIHAGKSVSVWALVWSAGSRTPIHDHHCSCCFGVLQGTVRESWFHAVDSTHAVIRASEVRAPGFVACMMPTGPNIHQMINDGPDDAVSIHIYGYDHDAHPSSVDREYRLAAC